MEDKAYTSKHTLVSQSLTILRWLGYQSVWRSHFQKLSEVELAECKLYVENSEVLEYYISKSPALADSDGISSSTSNVENGLRKS